MRPDPDPSRMTPDDRRREAAAILAFGLRRLRERSAIRYEPAPEIPSESAEKSLEAVPENRLTVHDG